MEIGGCRMKESLGQAEACPGEPCPFWERGGCAFQSLDLRGRPELAGFLLGLRAELASFRDAEDSTVARSVFFHRLNAGCSD
jgi:hypothetical protein